MDARTQAAAILLVLVAAGASVWFGLWRSWARTPSAQRNAMLVLPWASIAMLDLLLTEFLGFPAPDWLADGVMYGAFALGLTAATFERPLFLLPPWYRALKQAGDRSTREHDD